MTTFVGSQATVVGLVRALIELELDAVDVYGAAIDRLKDSELRRVFGLFKGDHERRAKELSTALEGMGERVSTMAERKAVLTKGTSVIGGLGGDRAVMMAMKTNEADTTVAYERSAERLDAPEELRVLFNRGLSDERRHAQYIDLWLSSKRASQGARPRY